MRYSGTMQSTSAGATHRPKTMKNFPIKFPLQRSTSGIIIFLQQAQAPVKFSLPEEDPYMAYAYYSLPKLETKVEEEETRPLTWGGEESH